MLYKDIVLVSCSSGLDSTCTLKILQLSGYENIVPIHFKYGARSGDAEELAIQNICNQLKLSPKIFDVSNIYKEMDIESISMLSNKKAPITTGTSEGLKSVQAWTSGRNMLFQTIMMTFAEAEVMKHNYEKVYFCAGWNQLTESACYPDNTKYFSDACINMAKYGTLVGNRFSILYCLSNLMKYEQYVLAKEFNFLNLLDYCISCDRAKVINGIPCNCSKNGLPACGSGLLSAWSEKMIGIKTNRNFYEVDDPGYEAHIPQHIKNKFSKIPNIDDIINRILLPKERLDTLRKLIKKDTDEKN